MSCSLTTAKITHVQLHDRAISIIAQQQQRSEYSAGPSDSSTCRTVPLQLKIPRPVRLPCTPVPAVCALPYSAANAASCKSQASKAQGRMFAGLHLP